MIFILIKIKFEIDINNDKFIFNNKTFWGTIVYGWIFRIYCMVLLEQFER